MLAVRVEGTAPFIEVEQDNGDECRLWRITDSADLIQKVQREMPNQPCSSPTAITATRRRSTTATSCAASAAQGTAAKPSTYIMTYFANMNDDDVVILPTHRLVRGYSA